MVKYNLYIIIIICIDIIVTNIVGWCIEQELVISLNIIQHCSNKINFHLGYTSCNMMYYYDHLIYTQVTEKFKPADQTHTWLHVDEIYILFTMHIICIEIRTYIYSKTNHGRTCEHVPKPIEQRILLPHNGFTTMYAFLVRNTV